MRPAPGVFAPPTSPWRDPFLWLVLLAQTGLSLPGILTRSLWVDEAYSAILARRSFAGIRETLRYDSGPPLHYDLLRLWRWVFGESALALRSLSLLFALATTALLYRLAARRFDRATARMAAAVFATLPVVGFYAGQARAYALLAFLAVLLATILAEPHLGRRLRFGALSAVLVITVYTHNIGWFLAAAAVGAAALAYGQRIVNPWLAIPALAVPVAFAPWIPILRAQRLNIEWVRPLWSPWGPLQSLAGIPPFGLVPAILDLPRLPGAWWMAITAIWLLPAAYALVVLVKERSRDLAFLVAFLVLGLALPAIASSLLQPMSLPGRHDFFLVPVVVLLVAIGLRRTRPALGGAGAYLSIIVALGVWSGTAYSARTARLDEREWTQAIADRAVPGDTVLCMGLTRPAAEYYLGGRGLRFASYPRHMELALAHLDEAWYLDTLDLPAEAKGVLDEVTASLRPGSRLWVVTTSGRLSAPLFDAIDRSPHLSREQRLMSPQMGLRVLNHRVVVEPLVRRDDALPAPDRPLD